MLRTNTVFCCHRNEIIALLKEDFGYKTRLPLTGPIVFNSNHTSIMHRFRYNQVLPYAGNDVIVLSPLGGAVSVFHHGF